MTSHQVTERATEAAFVQVEGHARFCLWHLPPGKPRSGIVYLPPFAEEMNRSRAVVARQARAFAAAGHAVLQMDLYGCGDSAGDFGEASWARWRSDAHAAITLMRDRFDVPLCLWGLRSGALLAGEVARELDQDLALLLWQPVLSGKQHLQQFLRLNLAAEILDGKAQGSTETLLARLDAGQAIEVAGYILAPALAQGLAASVLAQPDEGQRMHCMEIASGIAPNEAELSPALQRFVEGGAATATVCADAQCWFAQGVLTCQTLESATLTILDGMVP